MKIVNLAIQLQLGENGEQNVGLKGPLNDRVLCLGMLELAKDVILNGKTDSGIAVVQSAPLGGLRT
jgi:hypothetical protein